MNRRLTTILFFAFIVAAISSYLVYRVAGAQMNGAKGPKTTRIWLLHATWRSER